MLHNGLYVLLPVSLSDTDATAPTARNDEDHTTSHVPSNKELPRLYLVHSAPAAAE